MPVAKSTMHFDFIDSCFWCEEKKKEKGLCKVQIVSTGILCLAAIPKKVKAKRCKKKEKKKSAPRKKEKKEQKIEKKFRIACIL